MLQGFCLDTNLTTVKKRGNFSGFFNEWSLPPAKTTPALLRRFFFLKRQSEHFLVECRNLSAVISVF